MDLKNNYDKLMQDQISNFDQKKKILLHSCCGPCSSAVIERLKPNFEITVFYYNPNIYPKEEFDKRLQNQQIVIANNVDVKLVSPTYNEREYLESVKGLESEKEGGKRCDVCFYLRLKQTAVYAKKHGFDFFGTTLTVSSHKNEQHINKIGQQIASEVGISFLFSDFKKHDGYKRSIILSKQMNLYRQNYCGCRFSMGREQNKWNTKIINVNK